MPSPCDPNAACTNTPGNYTCGPCNIGYSGDGYTGVNHTGCVEINTCASHPCDPLTTCSQWAPGQYQCGPCPPGYSGDGNTGCERNYCLLVFMFSSFTALNCPGSISILNAGANCATTSVNANCTVSCNSGYKGTPSAFVCSNNAVWTGSITCNGTIVIFHC